MDQYVVGDVLRFASTGWYKHLALYIGNGRVAHFWSDSRRGSSDWGDNSIRIDNLSDLANVGGFSSPECCTEELDSWMDIEPSTTEVILERVRSRFGHKGYHIPTNNCEHFVTWARYGHQH